MSRFYRFMLKTNHQELPKVIAYGELSPTRYSPFGAVLEGRKNSSQNKYRRGFNGMEKDDETYEKYDAYDFGARVYDARLGRWWSVDPLSKIYIDLSPYLFVDNNPIKLIDSDGRVITIPDGKGGVIIYSPNMKTEGYENNAQVKMQIEQLNKLYKGSNKSKLDKLHSSEVEYNITISLKGKGKNIDYGGITRYNFEKDRIEIEVVEDANNSLTDAILADELTHATQFEDGQLGFIIDEAGFASVGYDLRDEIESKISSYNTLTEDKIQIKDMKDDGTESFQLLKMIDNKETKDEDYNKWLKEKSIGYKGIIPKEGNTMDKRITGEQGVKSAIKKREYGEVKHSVYRKDGKTYRDGKEFKHKKPEVKQ